MSSHSQGVVCVMLRVAREWTLTVCSTIRFAGKDDQHIVNVLLHERGGQQTAHVSIDCNVTPNEMFSVCIVDQCSFASGVLSPLFSDWMKHVEEKHLTVYTIHANFLIGNDLKMKKMKEAGVWLSRWPEEIRCESYVGRHYNGTKQLITLIL
jgi:hypothetical protein